MHTSARLGDKVLVEANVRTIRVNVCRDERNDFNTTDGPLASLDVLISNTESGILLVKGDMLMHIGALAEDRTIYRLD